MDIASITSAYSAVKGIKEIGTAILSAKIDAEAEERVNQVLEKLGPVQDALFYIREELLHLQEENQQLKRTIKGLEEKLNIKEKLIWEKPFYWIVENDSKDGPFCQKCYDSDQKLIRLQGGGNDIWKCLQCNSVYYGPNYRPSKPVVSRKRSRWLDGLDKY